MQNIITTLIITVVGGVLLLLFEYFVLKGDATAGTKFLVAVTLSFSLFTPLVLIRLISLLLIANTMKQQSEAVRIDWYANVYAVVAMLWGWLWGTKTRPWVHSLFEKRGG